jgi:WD40 repeat protein
MAAVATLLVAVAAGATAVALQYRLMARKEERLHNEAQSRAEAEAKAKQDLESSLYYHRIALAHRELSADNLGRALELLDECPNGLRQWEWDYLERLCRVEPLVFHDPGKKEVSGVAFSPDGERLAASGGDGTVKVWSSRTGEVIQTLDAQTDFVFSVAFHPGGNHLASAGADREVRVWDLTTGHTVFTGPGYVGPYYGTAYGVAFSPDGRRLAAGSDGAVNIWEWRNRQLLHTLPGHRKQASIVVAFSPDGRRLASGSWNGDVMIWDSETGGRPLHTMSRHRHPVSALAFSPDGRRLASASFDGQLIVWDATTGRLRHLLRGHDGLVLGVAFSPDPDGLRLASAGLDKTVRVWEAATGREVLVLRGHTNMAQYVVFSPDGRRLASCGRDGTIRLWDATPLQGNEGREVFTSQPGGEVWSMAVSPDGRRIASAGPASPGSLDTTVKVWDVRSDRVSVEFTGHSMVVFSVAWHPDGQRIASAGGDQQLDVPVVKVWDAQTGRQAFPFPLAAKTKPHVVAFSPDGRFLVTGGVSRIVEVWDVQTGGKVSTLGAHDRQLRGLVFSPDRRLLASASDDGTVKLWDATRLGEKQVARHIIRARAADVTMGLAFSLDGRRLAAGGEEDTVRIWDVETERELQALRGHSGDVYAVAFSPDLEGRWVASAGEDSTVKLWDAEAGGAPVHTFRGHTKLVSSLAFSSDGRLLVSGSRDGTVKGWDVTPWTRSARSKRSPRM